MSLITLEQADEMNEQSKSVTYWDVETCKSELTFLQHLLNQKKFIDLKIKVQNNRMIDAHRVILALRFPYIEGVLPDEANGILDLSHYSEEVVELALAYAYTGTVQMTANNANELLCLAAEFDCSTIMEWCADFYKTRITIDNMPEIWTTANLTGHEGLLNICMPIVEDNFVHLLKNNKFWKYTKPHTMAMLLHDDRIEKEYELDGINESTKVHALSKWISGIPIPWRADRFQKLLSYLTLSSLSLNILIELHIMATKVGISLPYLEKIKSAIRTPRISPPPPRYSYSGETSSASFSRQERLLMCNSLDEDRGKCVVTEVEQFQGSSNIRFNLPYRFGCEIVSFRNWICVIGGQQGSGLRSPSPQFDILNLESSNVFKGPDLNIARFDHAATTSKGLIFVFGGETTERYTSRCEVFDYRLTKWMTLPRMPSARWKSKALIIPGEGVLVVGGGCIISRELSYPKKTLLLCGDPEGAGQQRWSWSELPPTLNNRFKPGVAYFKGRVFIAGGNVDNHFDIEQMIYPLKGKAKPQWTSVSLMELIPANPYYLVVYDEKLFLIYGEGNILEFSPPSDEPMNVPSADVWKMLCKLNKRVEFPLVIAPTQTES